MPTDLRRTLQGVGRSFPASDLALWAAGVTFFGLVGIVPAALVALRLAAALVGAPAVTEGVDVAIRVCPPGTAPRRRCAP